jgi:hypothetical protein
VGLPGLFSVVGVIDVFEQQVISRGVTRSVAGTGSRLGLAFDTVEGFLGRPWVVGALVLVAVVAIVGVTW